MRLFRRWRTRRHAKRDAEAGVDLGRRRVVALVGARPEFNPEEYPDQGFLADALQDEARVQELREIALGSDRGTPDGQVIPVPVLLVGLLFFLIAEAAAAIRLMTLLGLPPMDRLILGVALACILVALTYAAHSVINGAVTGIRAAGVIASYGIFLTATAALRLSDLAVPADDPTLSDWMSAVLLVLAAAGPAVMAEVCLRELRESAPGRRLKRNHRNELRTTEREINRAKRDLTMRGRKQREWDEEYSRLMALYNAVYAGEAARNGKLRQEPSGG